MELHKLLVEFLGTALFLSIIEGQGQPIPIAIGLLAAIYFGGSISGGHFNPAVSVMKFFQGDLSYSNLIGYVAVQVLGGLAALAYFRRFMNGRAAA